MSGFDGRLVVGSDLGSNGDRSRPGLPGPAVAETLRATASLRSPESSLQALIGMMIESGPWTAGSICLLNSAGLLETAAYLDARAGRWDRLQTEFDEGPAYDAVRVEPVQQSSDLAGESRWASWSAAAASLGARSTMSVRLFTDTSLGTVNLYSTRPDELDPATVAAAEVLSAPVSAVVAAIATERHLRRAMWSRNVIGQAQGILMERDGLTAVAAIDVLRRRSQQGNIKLIVLACRIAGMVPDIDDGS